MSRAEFNLSVSHREETDGTHTVMATATGIPDLKNVQKVADWMHKIIKDNAYLIGEMHINPPDMQ